MELSEFDAGDGGNRRICSYVEIMKTLVTVFAILMCAAPAYAAEKLSLTEISAYLNDLSSAQGTFTQINDDGSLSTGALMIKRPGKMRFEYDPPDAALVVAGAGAVAIFDKKSNQPPDTYPLNQTPLSIILARNVNLEAANMVVGHAFDGTSTQVVAQDPKHPEFGRIELSFTDSPVELRKWVVFDAHGGQTTVILGALETGVALPDRLFSTTAQNDR